MMVVTAVLCFVFIASWLSPTRVQSVPVDIKDVVAEQRLKSGHFGDMMLTGTQMDYILRMRGSRRRSVRRRRRNVASNLWPNAIIPYEIDCSLENLPSAITAINEAMEEWQNKTCIRFVKHTNEKHYLKFLRGSSCRGTVGRSQTGANEISVGDLCEFRHVMSHELGHVIGFYHEHNRKDRDEYIDIKWGNIFDQKRDAFIKENQSESLGFEYDVSSIMHYSWSAFSKNGDSTIKSINEVIEQPYKFVSKIDAMQANLLYKCSQILTTTPKPTTAATTAATTVATTTASIQKKTQPKGESELALESCSDMNKDCWFWAEMGYCSGHKWYVKYCRRSCLPECRKVWCVDRMRKCKTWKRKGYCRLSGAIMQRCPKSCSPLCQPDAIKKLTIALKGTIAPADKKKSHTKRSETKKKNRGKARLSSDKQSGVRMGIGILCADKDTNCQFWANNGDCDIHREWMHRYCKVSCNDTNCDRVPQKPSGPCSSPLGIGFDGKSWKIPDNSMTSNSEYQVDGWSASASNARLYYEDDEKKKRIAAWCASNWEGKVGPYIEVDLGTQRDIKYIATQGRNLKFERVSKFRVKYSKNRRNWYNYVENGEIRKFDGNCDHFTPILNTFNNVIKARYFRYYPIKANYPCVRMELYGC